MNDMSDELVQAAATDDDALWQVLTSDDAETPSGEVVITTVVSVSRDVVTAHHPHWGTVLIPVTELPDRSVRPGDQVAGHVTGSRTAGAEVLACVRPTLVSDLFAGVVPELRDGSVRVMGIARVPGVRSKVSVAATVPEVDPVSAIVGKRANRVQAVSKLLAGERIDVVGWSQDRHAWLRRALAPADCGRIETVAGVTYVEAEPHLMSAAVGAGGLNSALAGRLTGCRVMVVPTGQIPADTATESGTDPGTAVE